MKPSASPLPNAQDSCPSADRLQALLEGAASQEEERQLSDHLTSCERCQDEIERLAASTRNWQLAAGAGVDSVKPWPTLARALEQSSEKSLEIPGKLGHYILPKLIGRGGMGMVLKAFDTKLHRVVALKVMSPRLAESPRSRERFLREARAAAAIKSEHVVVIYSVEEDEDVPFLVLEHVEGCSLHQLMASGPLPWQQVAELGRQAALGLAAAHAKGIVHRDVKPSNILVERSTGTVKVTDFGLAWSMGSPALTQSGAVLGTPEYMAPEQVRNDDVDHRADLFSLGSVLYALCTGKSPFRTGQSFSTMHAVATAPAPPIGEVNPAVPQWLCDVVARLHAKDPEARPASALEVAAELSRITPPPVVTPPPVSVDVVRHDSIQQDSPATTTLTDANTIVDNARAPRKLDIRVPRGIFLAVAATVAVLLLGAAVAYLSITPEQAALRSAQSKASPPGPGPPAPVQPPGTAKSKAAPSWTFDPQPQRVFSPPVELQGRLTVFGVALSPDGETIAVACGNMDKPLSMGSIHLINRKNGGWTYLGQHRHAARRVVFTPDGKHLVSVSGISSPHPEDSFLPEVLIWNVADREVATRIDGFQPSTTLQALAMEPLGRWFVVAGRHNDTRGLRIPDGGQLGRFPVRYGENCTALAVSSDGELIAAASSDDAGQNNTVQVFRTADRSLVYQFDSPPGEVPFVSGLAFRPGDEELIATTGNSGATGTLILSWDLKRKIANSSICHGETHILAMALSPDGRTIATGTAGVEGKVRLWDFEERKLLTVLQGDLAGVVYDVAFSQDGQTLIAGGGNGRVHVWQGRK